MHVSPQSQFRLSPSRRILQRMLGAVIFGHENRLSDTACLRHLTAPEESNVVLQHHVASKAIGIKIGTSKAETFLTVFVDFVLSWTVAFFILEKNRMSNWF